MNLFEIEKARPIKEKISRILENIALYKREEPIPPQNDMSDEEYLDILEDIRTKYGFSRLMRSIHKKGQ